jgi:hypothetical protein
MATKIFCDRCNSTERVSSYNWGPQHNTRDLCSNCTRNLTDIVGRFIANTPLAPVSPSLDHELDQFVADKPKDILK